jgi:hypothetical protein
MGTPFLHTHNPPPQVYNPDSFLLIVINDLQITNA